MERGSPPGQPYLGHAWDWDVVVRLMPFFVEFLMARTRYVDRGGGGVGVDDGLVSLTS